MHLNIVKPRKISAGVGNGLAITYDAKKKASSTVFSERLA